MTAPTRAKFATQVDPETLQAVRELAAKEGRQLQVLVEEALHDLIEKRKKTTPRASVMAAYQKSHETFSPLYRKLAQ